MRRAWRWGWHEQGHAQGRITVRRVWESQGPQPTCAPQVVSGICEERGPHLQTQVKTRGHTPCTAALTSNSCSPHSSQTHILNLTRAGCGSCACHARAGGRALHVVQQLLPPGWRSGLHPHQTSTSSHSCAGPCMHPWDVVMHATHPFWAPAAAVLRTCIQVRAQGPGEHLALCW